MCNGRCPWLCNILHRPYLVRDKPIARIAYTGVGFCSCRPTLVRQCEKPQMVGRQQIQIPTLFRIITKRQRGDDRGDILFMNKHFKNTFVSLFLLGLLSISLCACNGEDEPLQDQTFDVVTDSKDVDITVITESITPVSATFETTKSSYIDLYVSCELQAIEDVISQLKKMGHSNIENRDLKLLDINDHNRETLYNLESNTTYYYIGVIFDRDNNIKISPIKKFTTSEIELYVMLEGCDVVWCGVNFFKDRYNYEESQFLQSSLYLKYTLPSPSEETIEGNWRYPTKAELTQLTEACHITLLDYKLSLARLTDRNGKHLYINFTWIVPDQMGASGVCFPCQGGDYAMHLNINPIGWSDRMKGNPYFGNSLDKLPDNDLFISDKVYQWNYTDNNREYSGTTGRAVRFVMNK